jgi:hypothetical protein
VFRPSQFSTKKSPQAHFTQGIVRPSSARSARGSLACAPYQLVREIRILLPNALRIQKDRPHSAQVISPQEIRLKLISPKKLEAVASSRGNGWNAQPSRQFHHTRCAYPVDLLK